MLKIIGQRRLRKQISLVENEVKDLEARLENITEEQKCSEAVYHATGDLKFGIKAEELAVRVDGTRTRLENQVTLLMRLQG